ncbi:hypothetical protein ABTY63_27085 [Streptomyces solisilvae]|uniref:hypothetical protein n=1 Tax=Streptomyces malaysiensis TaxID=92644 RepID=UPI003327D246
MLALSQQTNTRDDWLVASEEAPKFAARERAVKRTESCDERHEEPRPDAVKGERFLAAAMTDLPRHDAH